MTYRGGNSTYSQAMGRSNAPRSLEDSRALDERMGAMTAPYDAAIRDAAMQARAGAITAGQTSGNAALGQRMANRDASRATAPLMAQKAAAQSQGIQREIDFERQRREAERQRERQLIGGLVGGAGSLLGTIVPGLGGIGQQAGQALGGGLAGVAQGQGAQAFRPDPMTAQVPATFDSRIQSPGMAPPPARGAPLGVLPGDPTATPQQAQAAPQYITGAPPPNPFGQRAAPAPAQAGGMLSQPMPAMAQPMPQASSIARQYATPQALAPLLGGARGSAPMGAGMTLGGAFDPLLEEEQDPLAFFGGMFGGRSPW